MTTSSDNSSSSSERYWAVIPAAGVGKRMKSVTPKQYLPLHNKPVIEHTIQCFVDNAAITGIVVAVSKGDEYWQDVSIDSDKPVLQAEGGEERCHSVLNALQLLAQHADENDWVLVHDAARPCLRQPDIDELVNRASQHQVGGILAVPVRDTMKRGNDSNEITETVDRDGLWHALTPQMFRLGELTPALEQALASQQLVTDDASAMELAGYRPLLVEGHADNIKITRPEDLALAEFYLQQNNATD